jgi:lipopolysaccharide transport system permease protein
MMVDVNDREKRTARSVLAHRVTVYSPEALILSPRRMLRDMVADLRAAQGLARRLSARDIKSQYRGSLLGYLWAFITPLVSTAMWIFLSGTGIVKVSSTDIPYPAYVFTGTMLWQLFTEALTSPLAQLGAGRSMLAKLNFPREALILSGLYKVLFSAVVKFVILVPAIMFFGVFPDLHLLLFPVGALALILAGLSVGLVLAPVGMLYKDVGRTLPIVAQFLMYISPVVFAMPTEGFTARLFGANPMSPLVLTARAWLTGSASPMPGAWAVVFMASIALLLLGWVLYRITMPVLVERMSS